MRKESIVSSLVVVSLLIAAVFITMPVVVKAGFPNTVQGWVEQNTTYGVRAWDASQNGNATCYIQNYIDLGNQCN